MKDLNRTDTIHGVSTETQYSKHGLGKHPENGGDEPLLLTVKGAQCCTLSAQGGLSGIAIKGSKGRNEQ